MRHCLFIQACPEKEPGEFDGIVWAKRNTKLPVVLTKQEVKDLISNLSGDKWIMANMLYGAGLRLLECLRLRVGDIDFNYRQIIVRDGKGEKNRVTMLPGCVKDSLKEHLDSVRKLHQTLSHKHKLKSAHLLSCWKGDHKSKIRIFVPPYFHSRRIEI